ncbi:MAG: right-handed parallel beta-helix repeat-containing protein [Planctomycetota bacterium]
MLPRLAPLLVVLAAAPASADTLWVDPVHGLPWNPGTEAEPLSSVSLALQGLAAAAGPHVVHLAPGDYSPASGESFPWAAMDDLVLAGDADGTLVSVPAGLASVFLDGSRALTLTNIAFEGTRPTRLCSMAAVSAEVTIERCVFTGFGALIGQVSANQQARIHVNDSEFYDCVSLGGNLGYAGGNGITSIDRCVFDGCEGVASGAVFLGTGSNVLISNSVIVRGTHPTNPIGNADYVYGCTIAFNQAPVPRLEFTISPWIENCIIAWNGDGSTSSVAPGNTVVSCLIHDAAGTDPRSVVPGPPLFVDGPAGDVRLRFGSPAVDVLPDGADVLDRTGRPRDVDGDLDRTAAGDLGALELRTLDRPPGAPSVVPLGQPYELEIVGPAWTFSTLAFSRDGLAASPAASPYGGIHLAPGAARVRTVGLGSEGRVAFDLPLGGPSSIIGLELGYQAITRSFASDTGAAVTNALVLTVGAP